MSNSVLPIFSSGSFMISIFFQVSQWSWPHDRLRDNWKLILSFHNFFQLECTPWNIFLLPIWLKVIWRKKQSVSYIIDFTKTIFVPFTKHSITLSSYLYFTLSVCWKFILKITLVSLDYHYVSFFATTSAAAKLLQ